MPSHHAQRPCFKELTFDDQTLTVRAVFTERRKKAKPPEEVWDYHTEFQTDYDDWKLSPNGAWFHDHVRDSGRWWDERIS